MKDLRKEPIAHLFPPAGPHLCKGIAPLVVRRFPTAKIYMRSWVRVGRNAENVSPANRAWIEKLPEGFFAGYLEEAVWKRHLPGRWGRRLGTILANTVLPGYSLKSWWTIWRGPRRWLYHSCLPMNIPTQLVFKLLGKEVVAIHWGLPLGHIPYIWPLVNFAHRFAKRIFVLMTPEKEFFAPCGCLHKVSVLSYPGSPPEIDVSRREVPPRVMILGNSTYNLDYYGPVLDRIEPGWWDRIICMLNYGRENERELVDAFVAKYRAKFGSAFFAWRETLPIDEYLEVMRSAAFYIGPNVFQSGLGAIFNSFFMGQEVVITGHNYAWLKELGACIHKLEDVGELSYDNLMKRRFPIADRKRAFAALRHYFIDVANEENWTESIWRAFEAK